MQNPHDRPLRTGVAAASMLAVLGGSLFYILTRKIRVQNIPFFHSDWCWASLAVLLAAAIWIAVVWILVDVWERRMLKTSLYNVELDQIIMSDAAERLTRS